MKRFVGLLLAICLLVVLCVPAFAVGVEKLPEATFDGTSQAKIMDIPIFVILTDGIELTEEQKDKATASVANYCNGAVEQLNDNSATYKVTQLNDTQKRSVFKNPIYTSTFQQIEEMISRGVKVKYVNLFSGASNVDYAVNASGDPDDVSYWENNCQRLGTYNGYKFLYLESSTGVESSEVTPGNISGSWQWDEIAKKFVEVVCDHYVKGDFYKAVKAASEKLSTLFSIYESPLTISYSSSEGYVKAKVSGDIYIRTVLIRDDLDRVEGYAYYSWGTTQRFAAALRVDSKYPYKRNASGTYEYRYPSKTYPTKNSSTPGYYGNATLYASIIQLYYNTIGYFTHDESIDVTSAVASMLS